MAMPIDFVMVRHGQSEANVLHKDDSIEMPEGFYDRHDTHMRLTEKGRAQAAAAGKWLTEQFNDGFDRYYVSPLMRTRETAGSLAINGEWRLDDRWRERDWGEYGMASRSDQAEIYEASTKMRSLHKWYWRPQGGESLASDVRLRFEDILETTHRESEGKRFIAVSHGEMIGVARYVLERMDPDQWLTNENDPARDIKNCQILHYTRIDPQGGEVAPQLRWMRSICPWDEKFSWEGGQFMELTPRRIYSDEDLLRSVEVHPPLITTPTSTDSVR